MNSQVDTFNELEKEFMRSYNVGNTVEVNNIEHKEIIYKKEDKIEFDNNNLDSIKDFNNSELDAIKSFFVKES